MNRLIEKVTSLFKGSNPTDKHIPTLYTLSGCPKCDLIKRYMKDNKLPYLEKDINKAGKQDFRKFHMANFDAFVYGPKGCISFPIYVNGNIIRQGLCNVLAYLTTGNRLAGFFSVGFLHLDWIDGIYISGGNSESSKEFLAVLKYLKENGLKLKIETNGKNSKLLKQVLDKGLADFAVMDVLGPRTLYSRILGEEINLVEVEESLALIPNFPQYKFQTTILPVNRNEEGSPAVSYLTTKEVEETALFIKEATGSMQQPYLLKMFDPENETNKDFEAVEPMEGSLLIPYRSAARMHQLLTEIESEQP